MIEIIWKLFLIHLKSLITSILIRQRQLAFIGHQIYGVATCFWCSTRPRESDGIMPFNRSRNNKFNPCKIAQYFKQALEYEPRPCIYLLTIYILYIAFKNTELGKTFWFEGLTKLMVWYFTSINIFKCIFITIIPKKVIIVLKMGINKLVRQNGYNIITFFI